MRVISRSESFSRIQLPREDDSYPVVVRLPLRLRTLLARVFGAVADAKRGTRLLPLSKGNRAEPQSLLALLKRCDKALRQEGMQSRRPR